jgi:hypothetical protein
MVEALGFEPRRRLVVSEPRRATAASETKDAAFLLRGAASWASGGGGAGIEPLASMTALHALAPFRQIGDLGTAAAGDLAPECRDRHPAFLSDDGQRIDDEIVGRRRVALL